MEVKVEVKECMYDIVYYYYYLFDNWEEHKDVIKNVKDIHADIKEFEINYHKGKYYYKAIVIEKKQFVKKERESEKVIKKNINKKVNKEVNISDEEIYEKYEGIEDKIK